MNTDRASRSTGTARIATLTEAGVRIGMDGMFIERLRRSPRYEAVHLQDIVEGSEAGRIVNAWITFSNIQ